MQLYIEPFPGRNAATTRDAIEYLTARYGQSPACHRLTRLGNKPIFFIYDSYLIPPAEWATVLEKAGTNTIRGSASDAVVIGLCVKKQDGRSILDGGFDGFYTYFATDGFTYGSTTSHWPQLAEWACAHAKLFVPCVAPGTSAASTYSL